MTKELNLLTDEQLALLKELINRSDHIIICAHKNPDGDALGASLAWAEYLRQIGKSPRVIMPDAWPDFLQWLPDAQEIIRYDKHPEVATQLFEEADLLFCMDMNTSDRVLHMAQAFNNSLAQCVLIDHHLNPDLSAILTISYPELSSTSEIVFRLLWQLDAFEAMDKKMATNLYCGMMTDTGSFTYSSSRPEIYDIIGKLLTKHINKDKIYRKIYNTLSPWALRLRGYVIFKKMNVLEDGRASYFSLSREEMTDFHFIKGDAEGLVNEPLRIKGMRVSISLREDDRVDNLIWVSLRSVDDFPCNKMAEQFFDGGGHLNASGGKLNCSLEEAEKITRQAIVAFRDLL